MVTATLTNVIKNNENIVVAVRFSDGEERTFNFSRNATRFEIKQEIKRIIDEKNDLVDKIEAYKDLIGMELT